MKEQDREFNILEIFSSISGEAQHAGELSTFIRLAGCNLNCSWCDTMNMLKENNYTKMNVDDIIEMCHKNGHKHVIVTGGEPLMKSNIDVLISELLLEGFEVEIETNGSQDFHKLVEKLDEYELPYNLANNYSFTLDYKMPGSGMTDKMNPAVFEHLDDLNCDDVIKFVITEDDIEPCMELIKKFQDQGTLCKYYISPVFGSVEMPHIIDAMKAYNFDGDVRFQLQIHKYVWDPNKTGV